MAGMKNERGNQVVRMITHNGHDQWMKLSENPSGEFNLITQNGPKAAFFVFAPDAPDYVQDALRNLQVAMERANREGSGGGTNSQLVVS
jgi:hypothetical protein